VTAPSPKRPVPIGVMAKVLFLVGLGLTLFGCCCVCGGLALWFFVVLPARPERQIVGAWQVDIEATKAANPSKWHLVDSNLALEFNQDGTCRMTRGTTEGHPGTWKVISKKDNKLSVQIQLQGWALPMELLLVPKDRDHLLLDKNLHNLNGPCELKRVAAFPAPPKYVDDDVPIIKPRTQFSARVETIYSGGRYTGEKELFLCPDGSRIAIRSNVFPSKTQVWDIAGQPRKLYDFDGYIHALSPDGKSAIRSGPSSIEIAEFESGKKLVQSPFGGGHFFGPSGQAFAMMTKMDFDGKPRKLMISEFDPATGKNRGNFEALGNDRVEVAGPVKNGNEFFFGTDPNRIQVYDLSARKVVREFTLALDAKKRIDWLYFVVSPDGKWIAVRVRNGTEVTTIFDGTTGAQVVALPPALGIWHANFVSGRDLFLAPSSIARKDKKSGSDIVAYDIAKKRVVAAFRPDQDSQFAGAAVSADGKVLAAGTKDGKVILWDLTQLK